MNVGTIIILMLALALAAIGSSTRYQADVSNNSLAVRGHNLNHNETLVRDTTLIQTGDWSLWLNSEQSFTDVPLLAYFLSYRAGLSCSPLVCGTNHNETQVNDEATTEQADDWNQWQTRKHSFVADPFLGISCPAGLAPVPTVVVQPQQYVQAVGRPSAVAADE